MNIPGLARRYLPILDWGARYTGKTFANDLIVAAIVTVMLIPQSLAYALLAGLPPQVGLYASMAPLVLYAIFGTSRALAVGPVAVASLMTAAAAAQVAKQGTPEYLGAAIALAAISGLLLVALGLLRLGFLANFLSHPVIAGFITASGIQIAAGQLAPVLGIKAGGESFLDLVKSMVPELGHVNPYTAAIGVASLVFLFWVRSGLKPLLRRFGLGERAADILAKVGPVVAIAVTTVAVWGLGLTEHGVKIVGTVPKGLPKLVLPPFEVGLWAKLVVPALLISIVGYVESISVALTLAAKRRQSVDPDQELIALGMSKPAPRPPPPAPSPPSASRSPRCS
jgi:SulP family sulfate permease